MMKTLWMTFLCLLPLCVQAQDNPIWSEGSEWEVYYTDDVEPDSGVTSATEVHVAYRLKKADDDCLALEKVMFVDNQPQTPQLQGYIRTERNGAMVYVRPMLIDGRVGEECLLYDFSQPFEYGRTIRYGVYGGGVQELYIDWQEGSLDYFMLHNGSRCLPAWKGIVYQYGFLGGPMELFFGNSIPSHAKRPRPSNISHVIFTSKGGQKRMQSAAADEAVQVAYEEMLTEGSVWECLGMPTDLRAQVWPLSIRMHGDTLVGNRLCKLLFSPELDRRMTVFEEGRKLYAVGEEGEPEVILDFGMQQGDLLDNGVGYVLDCCMEQNLGYHYPVITIDTGLDCTSLMSGDTAPWLYQLIEGIGVSKDEHLGHRLLSAESAVTYLQRCWKDGLLVYQSPWCKETSIRQPAAGTRSPCFDLQGRRFDTPPSKGIYIQNRRKIIVQ